GEERPRADEHDVRAGAQQREHEAVGLTAVADRRVGAGEIGHRDDAVERLDEVRDQARDAEAERAAVEALDLGWKLPAGQLLVLFEYGEGLDHRVSVMNSLRSVSSS